MGALQEERTASMEQRVLDSEERHSEAMSRLYLRSERFHNEVEQVKYQSGDQGTIDAFRSTICHRIQCGSGPFNHGVCTVCGHDKKNRCEAGCSHDFSLRGIKPCLSSRRQAWWL